MIYLLIWNLQRRTDVQRKSIAGKVGFVNSSGQVSAVAAPLESLEIIAVCTWENKGPFRGYFFNLAKNLRREFHISIILSWAVFLYVLVCDCSKEIWHLQEICNYRSREKVSLWKKTLIAVLTSYRKLFLICNEWSYKCMMFAYESIMGEYRPDTVNLNVSLNSNLSLNSKFFIKKCSRLLQTSKQTTKGK